ncbi:C6 finger domain-containing protein [Colletotrichum truncatum]|uniref:C6 finger domain-containing protein n=1 Tax=Colletotrichum truncatum TaxID=5467 RepID=A0ACC3YSG5_COLTU|nr:C6 finger domain-containing protein [Colletotrichum truncatum]KAF6789822.1 C6 finger domain-containing protein [Colletotrichum truncatum]
MSLGPFDRRTRRSRCFACAASHSKCSGVSPCTRCQKREIECLFSTSPPGAKGAVIKLERGKMHTPKDFRPPAATRPQKPIPDATTSYLFYFDMFVRTNSFTGREPSFIFDVQHLIKSSNDLVPHPSRSLFDAMLALGAMQAHSLGAMTHRNNLGFALRSYQQSIHELRNAVSNFSPTQRDSIAWSTFFLGLFELLQDASGQKWLQHMVFGTAQALVASGPAVCESGTMKTFFIQARTFEACRSIIFNQPSFLASPEWISLTDYLSTNLDEILKLVVLCSSLRVRTAEFTSKAFPAQVTSDANLSEGLELATDGFGLREALDSWKLTTWFLPESPDEMLLSSTYYSATSIYLSGNYDYDLAHWQAIGVAVPILSAKQIEVHFDAIVVTVKEALKGSRLSPLLFLFPLRVAGSRAKQSQQREAVIDLLQIIRRNFIVADTMLEELKELWTRTVG